MTITNQIKLRIPVMEYKETSICPVCSATVTEKIFVERRWLADDECRAAYMERRCRGCGFTYAESIPPPPELWRKKVVDKDILYPNQ